MGCLVDMSGSKNYERAETTVCKRSAPRHEPRAQRYAAYTQDRWKHLLETMRSTDRKPSLCCSLSGLRRYFKTSSSACLSHLALCLFRPAMSAHALRNSRPQFRLQLPSNSVLALPPYSVRQLIQRTHFEATANRSVLLRKIPISRVNHPHHIPSW